MEDLVPRTIDSSSRREIRFSAISDGDSKVRKCLSLKSEGLDLFGRFG